MCRLYSFKPEVVACDLHPDYASTQWAERFGLPLIRVQHHQAHVAACAAENNVQGAYLGISWDGTGYGLDGAIWGGEFFRAEGNQFERVAHLRSFGLPGGDAAVREGWRSAASLIFQVFGSEPVLLMPGKGANPRLRTKVRICSSAASTSSPQPAWAGCLTPWPASLAWPSRTGLKARPPCSSKMKLALRTEEAYPLPGGDWGPLILAVMADKRAGVTVPLIAARFHNALVTWILEVAAHEKLKQIVLSGGVFQNRYLTERAAAALESRGFVVHTHQRVPPNDGGIALGQAVMSKL